MSSSLTHFSSGETGILLNSHRPKNDKEWNYLRPIETAAKFLKFYDNGDGTFECGVLDGFGSKSASNMEDGSWATRDMFTPHPARPGLWKYIGRKDDWIILLNGEKINPIPFEHIVRQNPYVSEAIVFGAGRHMPGLIIIASSAGNDLSPPELKEKIGPTLTSANAQSDRYAQISPEMIMILPMGTNYRKTDKGTVIRYAFYEKFKDLIASMYQNEHGIGQDGLVLDEDELCPWLRNKVLSILDIRNHEISDHDDFFSLGMDSLQAFRLYSVIIHELNLGDESKKLNSNVAFEHPNVEQLAKSILKLRNGTIASDHDNVSKMKALIERFATFTKSAKKSRSIISTKHCVVTDWFLELCMLTLRFSLARLVHLALSFWTSFFQIRMWRRYTAW